MIFYNEEGWRKNERTHGRRERERERQNGQLRLNKDRGVGARQRQETTKYTLLKTYLIFNYLIG